MRGQAGARNLEAEATLDTNMLQHSASVKARIASDGGVTVCSVQQWQLCGPPGRSPRTSQVPANMAQQIPASSWKWGLQFTYLGSA